MKTSSMVIKCILAIGLSTGASADRVYTMHTGGSSSTSDGTTPANPVTLTTALAIANSNPSRQHIVFEHGPYAGIPQLLITADDVCLDGGYEDVGGIWRKSYDATMINIVAPEETVWPSVHKRGIVASGRSGLVFQDLNLIIAAPAGQTSNRDGKSVYGIYLESCSDYTVRSGLGF